MVEIGVTSGGVVPESPTGARLELELAILKKCKGKNKLIDLFHSESFWVSVAFFIFIALSFKKGKRLLLTSLDSRIENIVKNIGF